MSGGREDSGGRQAESSPVTNAVRGWRESITSEIPSPTVFGAMQRLSVVAGFCGHDHANDFCAEYGGVQLCYTGSAGYTAYGQCFPDNVETVDVPSSGHCLRRRVRVTELTVSTEPEGGDAPRLREVRSWLRLDGGGSVAAADRTDERLLWRAEGVSVNSPGP